MAIIIWFDWLSNETAPLELLSKEILEDLANTQNMTRFGLPGLKFTQRPFARCDTGTKLKQDTTRVVNLIEFDYWKAYFSLDYQRIVHNVNCKNIGAASLLVGWSWSSSILQQNLLLIAVLFGKRSLYTQRRFVRSVERECVYWRISIYSIDKILKN